MLIYLSIHIFIFINLSIYLSIYQSIYLDEDQLQLNQLKTTLPSLFPLGKFEEMKSL